MYNFSELSSLYVHTFCHHIGFENKRRQFFRASFQSKKLERGGALFINIQEMMPGKISILYYGLDHHYRKAEI
jgi:hypothetical protein